MSKLFQKDRGVGLGLHRLDRRETERSGDRRESERQHRDRADRDDGRVDRPEAQDHVGRPERRVTPTPAQTAAAAQSAQTAQTPELTKRSMPKSSTRQTSLLSSKFDSKFESPLTRFQLATPVNVTLVKPRPLVLNRYEVIQGKKGLLGEGSFSVVQKGLDTLNSNKIVAVKTYKLDSKGEDFSNNIKKFKRQIDVLSMLMERVPEESIQDATLRHFLLCDRTSRRGIDPKKCFLELIDYSKDSNGDPGPCAVDGKMYVVTEIADYSLKDYLAARSEGGKRMSSEAVRQIAKSFVVAMAMLHAKGLVHLDMKPENIMRAGTTWRVIDVDGCTPINTRISINDSSISFSPCYCAPEWANFLIEDADHLRVTNQLDVWSVGISLCELIMLDAVLKPKYVSIYKQIASHRKAGFLFLEWLADPKKSLSLDDKVKKYDPFFVDMVLGRMLTKKPSERCTLAQCLNHPYLKDCRVPGLDEDQMYGDEPAVGDAETDIVPMGKRRDRYPEEVTGRAPLHKGTLYKLNSDGSVSNPEHWLRRDVWLAMDGSLCYFSIKNNKRLVLLDYKHLLQSKLIFNKEELKSFGIPYVFGVDLPGDSAARQYYGAENSEELIKWVSILQKAMEHPIGNLPRSIGSGRGEFLDFKVKVRNRREPVDSNVQPEFQPVFQRELWKLNTNGDPQKMEDWTLRKMWLAKNGAFCYFSKKQSRELQYYMSDDVKNLFYRKMDPAEACRPHCFELTLTKASDGTQYAPGVFAAENEEVMQIFLGCVQKYQAIRRRGRGKRPAETH